MRDAFKTHGEPVGASSAAGRFVSIGDGDKQLPTVEGILLGIDESSKYPGTLIYTMGTKEEILKVGGNTFLSDKVVDIGALYRITFAGFKPSKRGKPYKTFTVDTVPAATVRAEGYASDYKSGLEVGDANEDE